MDELKLFKDVDVTLGTSQWSPGLKAFIFLEDALVLYAPEVLEERENLKRKCGYFEGYNQWAERYGLPWRAEEILDAQGRPMTVTTHVGQVESPAREFKFRPRHEWEKVRDFKRALKTGFNEWQERVIEEEKKILKQQRKLTPNLQSIRHAEWLVLYQFKKLSYAKICKKEMERSGIHDLNESTIAKGIKRLAKDSGIRLREPNKGGRRKKVDMD